MCADGDPAGTAMSMLGEPAGSQVPETWPW
jgi:hypothetical protein